MPIADELRKLDELRRSGALTEEEYAKAKTRVLEGAAYGPGPPFGVPSGFVPPSPANIEQQTRQWAMLIHISLLAGFVVPVAGLVVPILLWQIKKTDLPGVDPHGKVVTNWIISAAIYGIVSFALCFVFIGIPFLLVLMVLHIVFPIIGAVKANEGELWQYPLSIKFFWVE